MYKIRGDLSSFLHVIYMLYNYSLLSLLLNIKV